MQLAGFRGFTPIPAPCVFVNPIDGCSIYPCATFVCVESPKGQEFLHGPTQKIACMDMSPKGRMVAAGETGRNSEVYVWRYSDRTNLYRLSEHDGGIACLAFSQDERLLATFGAEGRLVIWDMATGNIVCHRVIKEANAVKWGGRVPDVKGRPTPTFYLATAGPRGVELHVVDPAKGTIDSELLPQGKYSRHVTAFAFTPTHLITATKSSDVLVFELHSRTLVNTYSCGRQGLNDLYTDLNDGGIIGVCGDGAMYAVNETGATELRNMGHPIAGVYNGSVLTSDGYMYSSKGLLWQCHSVPVASIDVCGNSAASVGADGTVKVWDHRGLKCTVSFDAKIGSAPSACAMSPTTLMVVGAENGTLCGYDYTSGERLFEIQRCHHTRVNIAEIAPTKRFFATGGDDYAVRIWDVRTRQMLTHLKNHTLGVTSLKFLPSAQFLYSGSADCSVCLSDLREEKMIERLTQFASHVTDVDVYGDFLITSTQDGHLAKFCVSQGKNAIRSVKTSETTCMAVCPDGSKFAVGHIDGTVSLWDLESFRKLESILVHGSSVTDLRFYSANKTMTSGADGGLSILNVQ